MNFSIHNDNDRQPILESFMPDWRDHWLSIDIVWDFYKTFHPERLEQAIKDYQR